MKKVYINPTTEQQIVYSGVICGSGYVDTKDDTGSGGGRG